MSAATMTLSHWSTNPIGHVRTVDQARTPGMKPEGFWVSVDGDDDWAAWNEVEQWRDLAAQIRYRVTLADSANVLHISSPAELQAFHGQFGMDSYYIEWARVAERWQGVVIAPYLWSQRLDGPGWYYGWDCASGCIWDADAIVSIVALSTVGGAS